MHKIIKKGVISAFICISLIALLITTLKKIHSIDKPTTQTNSFAK